VSVDEVVANVINYISTVGGAFLEFLGGKVLPAMEVATQSSDMVR